MLVKGLEGWHLLIIVGLIAVLFGSRRMPAAARSIGQSLRIFKSEMRAAHDEGDPTPSDANYAGSVNPAQQLTSAPSHAADGRDAMAQARASASGSTPAS